MLLLAVIGLIVTVMLPDYADSNENKLTKKTLLPTSLDSYVFFFARISSDYS